MQKGQAEKNERSTLQSKFDIWSLEEGEHTSEHLFGSIDKPFSAKECAIRAGWASDARLRRLYLFLDGQRRLSFDGLEGLQAFVRDSEPVGYFADGVKKRLFADRFGSLERTDIFQVDVRIIASLMCAKRLSRLIEGHHTASSKNSPT
jgi:hypothetical protein